MKLIDPEQLKSDIRSGIPVKVITHFYLRRAMASLVRMLCRMIDHEPCVELTECQDCAYWDPGHYSGSFCTVRGLPMGPEDYCSKPCPLDEVEQSTKRE